MKRIHLALTAFICLLLALPAIIAVTYSSSERTPYLYVGQTRTFLVTVNGDLYSWNNRGVPIAGTDDFAYEPEHIRDNVKVASSNDQHTVIVTRDNELWAHGNNRHGQLGDGTTTDRASPVKIMDGVEYAVTGRNYTVILTTRGEVLVSGQNQYFGLWGSTTNPNAEPGSDDTSILTPVKIMDNVRAISSGGNHVMVIKNNGDLWGWGDNQQGAIGNGTTTDVFEPELIRRNVRSVSTSRSKTVIVDNSGQVWEWGLIGRDQTDFRTESIYTSPRRINGNFESVYAGHGYTMALRNDGGLYMWGTADFAGASDYFFNPERVANRVAFVSAGPQHAVVIDQSGNVLFWARNAHGITDTTLGNQLPRPITIMSNLSLSAPIRGNRQTRPEQPIRQEPDEGYEEIPRGDAMAIPTPSRTLINNREVSFHSYNIGGYNYFKLRDIAYALNGTDSTFNVTWQQHRISVILTLGEAYRPLGGEMLQGNGIQKLATPSDNNMFAVPHGVIGPDVDHSALANYSVSAEAFLIDDYNYFKLRDLSEIVGFHVDWDPQRNVILISTD